MNFSFILFLIFSSSVVSASVTIPQKACEDLRKEVQAKKEFLSDEGMQTYLEQLKLAFDPMNAVAKDKTKESLVAFLNTDLAKEHLLKLYEAVKNNPENICARIQYFIYGDFVFDITYDPAKGPREGVADKDFYSQHTPTFLGQEKNLFLKAFNGSLDNFEFEIKATPLQIFAYLKTPLLLPNGRLVNPMREFYNDTADRLIDEFNKKALEEKLDQSSVTLKDIENIKERFKDPSYGDDYNVLDNLNYILAIEYGFSEAGIKHILELANKLDAALIINEKNEAIVLEWLDVRFYFDYYMNAQRTSDPHFPFKAFPIEGIIIESKIASFKNSAVYQAAFAKITNSLNAFEKKFQLDAVFR